jgi:hypothetical protein
MTKDHAEYVAYLGPACRSKRKRFQPLLNLDRRDALRVLIAPARQNVVIEIADVAHFR